MPEAGSSVAEQQVDWNELFRQQIPHALRLAVRLTGNLQDAEDIVQESLLRAARHRDSFRGDSTFRTWLSRIVVNVFRTWVSRSKPRGMPEETQVSSVPPPEQHLENAERAAYVAHCVSRLPDRQREVLVFSFYENMNATEVAEILEISVQNVHSTLSVAKRQLRESLSILMKDATP